MFQEFHGEHDQHPDILDRAAIARPQANSWNWQLTVLVGILFTLAALFLFHVYESLTSNAVRYTAQIWITWIAGGVGVMALASAFLLRRRSQIGWLSTTVLFSSMVALFSVFLGKLLLALSQSFIPASELPPGLWLEMGMLPLSCFMLYLIGQKAVREIFGVPFKWFWPFFVVGATLGAIVGGWLIS